MANTTKPTTPPTWTSGLASQIAQPTPSLTASGFTAGQRPTFQHLNWLLANLGNWVSYLDSQANGAVSSLEIGESMRLLGGGWWAYAQTPGTLSWSESFALSVPSIPDTQNTVPAGNISIAPGQVAYVVANLPFATTGNTTSGQMALTNLSYESGIAVGQTVTGQGIPANTTVVAISGTTVTMSNAATASASNVLVTFVASATLSVKAGNVASVMPAPNVIILATCTPTSVIVGVNAGQMRLYDNEAKRLLGTGFIHTTTTQAGQALSAGTAVYLSPGGGDVDTTQGSVQAGSTTVTSVGSTGNIAPGSGIAGTGIPSGTTVTATTSNTLTLSAAATATAANVSLVTQRIAGAAYAADASAAYGLVRGNIAGIVTTTPALSATAATTVRFMTAGLFNGFTGLTPGALYYLDPVNPGQTTTSKPATSQYTSVVGVALTSTSFYMQPSVMARPPSADSTFNDIILTPITGAANTVGIRLTDGNSLLFTVDNQGNVAAKGTLAVLGAVTTQSTLSVQGAVTSNTSVTAPNVTSGSGFKTYVGMATLSNVTLNASTGATTTMLDASGQAFTWVPQHSGSIVGVSGYNSGNASVQNGTAGAQYFVAKNGTVILNGPSAGLAGGGASQPYAKGAYTFVPGDAITIQARSAGTNPVSSAYVRASITVELPA